jgi:predicted transcriptional regulator
VIKQRTERTIGIQSIGKLEAEVFKLVCNRKNGATVRDIYEELRLKRRIAYTTVMSVMNSLTTKGLLKQDKASMAYMYKPTVTKEKLANTIIKAVIDKLLDGEVGTVVSHFAKK